MRLTKSLVLRGDRKKVPPRDLFCDLKGNYYVPSLQSKKVESTVEELNGSIENSRISYLKYYRDRKQKS